MKKSISCIFGATLLLFVASVAGAITIDLSPARGTTVVYDGAIFHVLTQPEQDTVSAGSGVIDPFLTIQKKNLEHSFNSDYFAVLDATRPMYNHSIQLGDLVEYNSGYYEFLLDINEPASQSLITQHELEVYVVPASEGGSINDYSYLQSVGNLIWDLDDIVDSQILYDYNLWFGSGQNIDASFELPTSLFAGYDGTDYIYLYSQFGNLPGLGGYASEDGYEEWCLREGGQGLPPPPVPEPATMLLLGTGLVGLAGFRKKFKK